MAKPVFCQNLVSNSSFEVYEECPTGAGQISWPGTTALTVQDWFNPISSSSDYFNACAPSGPASSFPVNVPNNWGYQEARTGNAYAGGYAIYRPESPESLPVYAEWAEYVETPLNAPLIAGHQYYVGYWIVLSHDDINSLIACDQWGAYLQEGYYFDPMLMERLPVTPQVVTPRGVIYTDTVNWSLVSGIFTADGGEDWLIIGNFTPFDSMEITKVYYLPYFEDIGQYISYYYMDDVCVLDLDGGPLESALHRKKICEDDSAYVTGRPGYQYLWSDGAKDAYKHIAEPGIYWVKSIDTAACSGYYVDSFEIVIERDRLAVGLGNDTILCNGTRIKLDAQKLEFDDYRWNTGDTTSSIEISQSGRYYVNASGPCYFGSDTIYISSFQEPILKRINDTVICEGTSAWLQYNDNELVYYWNTGETGCCVNVIDSGTYVVEAIDRCSNRQSDTVNVITTNCTDCLLLPNAFTPNNDGLNDIFRPISRCLFSSYTLRIFNRWGQNVYTSYLPEDGWDGTFNGQLLDIGVYYYDVKAQPIIKGINEVYIKGDFTLLR